MTDSSNETKLTLTDEESAWLKRNAQKLLNLPRFQNKGTFTKSLSTIVSEDSVVSRTEIATSMLLVGVALDQLAERIQIYERKADEVSSDYLDRARVQKEMLEGLDFKLNSVLKELTTYEM